MIVTVFWERQNTTYWQRNLYLLYVLCVWLPQTRLSTQFHVLSAFKVIEKKSWLNSNKIHSIKKFLVHLSRKNPVGLGRFHEGGFTIPRREPIEKKWAGLWSFCSIKNREAAYD